MKPKIPTTAPAALSHNPFTKLAGASAPASESAAKPPDKRAEAPVAAKAPPMPPRAVIRYERSGHGGKEVTILEQLALRDRDLEAHLQLLKKGLGCGGRVEDHTIVLQGDQRERVEAWLVKLGVPKITRGN